VYVADQLGRLDDLADAMRDTPSSRWVEAARLYVARDPAAAADVLADMGALTDEAMARLRAAELLGAAGERSRAEIQRAAAAAFFRRVGATRYLREAEQLLAATA
jgi:hypothetical protein